MEKMISGIQQGSSSLNSLICEIVLVGYIFVNIIFNSYRVRLSNKNS